MSADGRNWASRLRTFVFFSLCFMAIVLLQACAVSPSVVSAKEVKDAKEIKVGNNAKLPTINGQGGFFIPKGGFSQRGGDGGVKNVPLLVSTVAALTTVAPSALTAEVVLYASPTTDALFSSGGFDAKLGTRVWEAFLRKYKIPFRVIKTVEQLEKSRSRVLLLPSTVAMSDAERRAVVDFRSRGGSVLASWLTGVRGENGVWQGFGFMESALNVKVLGDTESELDDNFMMLHGDNPITHHLPAGLRVWLDRAKDWYPLRLEGGQPAANIMNWSRGFVPGKPTTAIVFDERKESSGFLSRSVVLGYPERLWLSADPKLIEAVAHNALMWLMRQPDAYLSAWPHPYSSAFVMAIEAVDVVIETDLAFAKMLEESGGRGTYYLLSEMAAKSAEMLKKIQARGHEIAYVGDRFDGFRDQSVVIQTKRLDSMRKVIKEAGLNVADDAGFRAPMDSYDKTTERLVNERGFGHYVAFMDATDSRLPFVVPKSPESARASKSLIGLPRTQTGPEEWMEEGDPEEGLLAFFEELKLAEQMSGLSIVRVPNQSLMTSEQLEAIFKHLKARRDRMWSTTAGQVANWWRDRERVSVQLESSAGGALLTVTIKGEKPLERAAAIWLNLPESGRVPRLAALGGNTNTPKVVSVDAWRSALVFDGWAPGEYQWRLSFDSPTKIGAY